MLVITRKLNEKLQIGDDVIVHVFNIQEGSVFLDITLPNGDLKCDVVGQNEEISITEEVKVQVVEIQGKRKVRLGVTAPGKMGVKRVEE